MKSSETVDAEEKEYMVKKQVEVLHESRGMIPDAIKRLHRAFDELQDTVEAEQELADSEEYTAAQDVLKSAQPMVDECQ